MAKPTKPSTFDKTDLDPDFEALYDKANIVIPFWEGSGTTVEELKTNIDGDIFNNNGDSLGPNWGTDAEGVHLEWPGDQLGIRGVDFGDKSVNAALDQSYTDPGGVTVMFVMQAPSGATLTDDGNLFNHGNSDESGGIGERIVVGPIDESPTGTARAIWNTPTDGTTEFTTGIGSDYRTGSVTDRIYRIEPDSSIDYAEDGGSVTSFTGTVNLNAGQVDADFLFIGDAPSTNGSGTYTARSEQFEGKVYAIYVWPETLSDTEIATLQSDVYGMFRMVPTADGTVTDGGETVSGSGEVIEVSVDGAVTEGGEAVAGDAYATVFATGTVTEGGETVAGDVDHTVTVTGSVTDGGETVAGNADTVPATEPADIQDGVEVVEGDAYMTAIATGSVTEFGEQVISDAYSTVFATGSLTEGGETVSGDADFQLLTTSDITDGSEEVGGFATNSVGEDKVLLRSNLDGTVVNFRARTLNVTTRMNACDNATFSVFLRPGEARPLTVGEPVSLYVDERQEDKIWAGTVDRYSEQDYTGAKNYTRVVQYQCVCYSALADRHHVSGSYRDELAGDIVRDILTTYLADEGVTAGTIEDGPTITKANFAYTPISKALNDLGDETGFAWFIDEDKKLQFRSRSASLGGLVIDDGNRPFLSMTINRGRREYRNRQIVRGGKGLTEERTETFVGDGESQTFTTVFDVAEAPTVTVNGVAQDVGISGLDDDADFYWNKGSNTIAQDDAAAALTASDTLSVTYIGLVPIAVEASDQEQINERAEVEGGQGVYENVVSDSSIEENDAALERAEGLLRRFARVDETVDFSIDSTAPRQGQLIEIDLPTRGLTGEYLLDSVNYRVKDNNEFRADVTALSGEAYGSWTKFFRELKEAKQEFTVRENEQVLLQRRIADEVEAVDAVTPSDDTVEAFIIGADGATPGGGDSRLGYVRLGDVGHEEGTETESVTPSDTTTTSTSALTFTIGTDEVGFSAVG